MLISSTYGHGADPCGEHSQLPAEGLSFSGVFLWLNGGHGFLKEHLTDKVPFLAHHVISASCSDTYLSYF
jgi:hypothetical protein